MHQVNKRRGALGLAEYDPIEFFGVLSEKMAQVSDNSNWGVGDNNRDGVRVGEWIAQAQEGKWRVGGG